MKIFNIVVTRPAPSPNIDLWELRRTAFVIGDSLDEAAKKAVDYYNDLNAKDDYYVTEVSIVASDTEGEGGVLIS